MLSDNFVRNVQIYIQIFVFVYLFVEKVLTVIEPK